MNEESYEIKNQFGQFYSGGPLLFITNSKKLFFPTKNSISVIDLINGKIESLNFWSRDIINTMDIDLTGKFLSVIDKTNLLLIIDIEQKKIKSKLLLKGPCLSCKWSPRGKYLALTISNFAQVWKIEFSEKNTQSFCQLARTYSSHYSEITSIDWNFSGKFFISAGMDFTIKIFPFRKSINFKEISLSGFMERILSVKFFNFSNHFLVLCENNILFKVELLKKKKKYGKKDNFLPVLNKNYIFKIKLKIENSMATSFWIHPFSKILFIGYSNGILNIYDLKKVSKKNLKNDLKNLQIKKIQKIFFPENFLSYISNFSICSNVRFFSLANLKKGKIVIYDKEKEEINVIYESLSQNLSCLSVSSNDKLVMVGNNKGKITIWSIKTGFCILKFSNHLLAINKVTFFKSFSRLAISTSKDGSLKIYDLKKCTVIRTFCSNSKKKNFDCIAINHSGFFIASSCQKTFKIYIWSIKNGTLIEILNGHESYINDLFFFEKDLKILSSSWDKTFRIWQFENSKSLLYECFCEIFKTNGKIFSTCLNPNSKEIAFFVQNDGFLFFNLILKKMVLRIKIGFKKNIKNFDFSENNFKKLSMAYSFNGEKFFFCSKKNFVFFFKNWLPKNENVCQNIFYEDIFKEINFSELNLRKKRTSNKILDNQNIDFIVSKKSDSFFILNSSVSFFSLTSPKVPKFREKNNVFKSKTPLFISEKTMKWFFFKKIFNFLKFQVFKKLGLLYPKKKIKIQTNFFFFRKFKKNFLKKKFFTLSEFMKIFFTDEKNIKEKIKILFEIKVLKKQNKILKKLTYLKTQLFFLF